MYIRPFKEFDLDRVYEIELHSFSDPFPKHLIKQLFDFGLGFLVAIVDDIVVGYLIFDIRKVGLENRGHIISLAVDPDYRRQKVATSLLFYSISILLYNKVRSLELEVKETNFKAINFYKKLGFYLVTITENYYNDGEDALILKLDFLSNKEFPFN